MAKPEHLTVLSQGRDIWNRWRDEHPDEAPDLRCIDLSNQDVSGFNFRNALLAEAHLENARLTASDLRWANLWNVKLVEAELSMARFNGADLSDADIRGGVLREVQLRWTSLWRVNFGGADLTGADLSGALFIETDLTDAVLDGSRVYGTSAWRLKGIPRSQSNLIITPDDESSSITVDDLEVAQFIYLLLHNDRVRKVIDSVTSKVVLILGRFTPDRKAVLDAIREELRKRDYLPIVFDFEKPSNRDLTETVSTLAHMAKFVIADLTDPRSIPQELTSIVRVLPSVPVQPILLASEQDWSMFEHLARFPWVLPIVPYETSSELLANLAERVTEPAEQRLALSKVGSSQVRV